MQILVSLCHFHGQQLNHAQLPVVFMNFITIPKSSSRPNGCSENVLNAQLLFFNHKLTVACDRHARALRKAAD